MTPSTEFLLHIRRIARFYETLIRPVCEEYGCSQIETDILAFLFNNPEKDTAKDIVELRMLQKGNVSLAVDSLIRNQFLIRNQDAKDRRLFHLSLTDKGIKAAKSIRKVRSRFQSALLEGFSLEEILLYYKMNQKIFDNAAKYTERT